MNGPVVLDIDGSVGPLDGGQVVALGEWQEALRFGCAVRTLRRFGRVLEERLPPRHATVMLGSGDFHHLSWPLIARARATGSFQVVVLDNHPDNMRYPFGVHCGSWVRRVAALPTVAHVHVVGIASTDIGAEHAWENYRRPLREGKLTYWSIGVDTGWARRAGLGHAFRGFDTAAELVAAFRRAQLAAPRPAYLSIDKDVFSADVVRTNWDQGRLTLEDALSVIDSLRGGLVGSDITGEVSVYRYRRWWKRMLSAMDAQPALDGRDVVSWQAQQHVLNEVLLAAIARRSAA
jgi:arginase family enzyme